jgi:Family of unknown function (DUF5335)
MTAASQANHEIPKNEWEATLDKLTTAHQGKYVTLELLSDDFGDEYEAQQIPFAYLEYDPKDDEVNVGVGGRDRRIPVVLRHAVEHPKKILVDAIDPDVPLAVDITAADDSRTVVSFLPGGAA